MNRKVVIVLALLVLVALLACSTLPATPKPEALWLWRLAC